VIQFGGYVYIMCTFCRYLDGFPVSRVGSWSLQYVAILTIRQLQWYFIAVLQSKICTSSTY